MIPIANALIQNSQHLLAVVASSENSSELADGYLDMADPIECKTLEVYSASGMPACFLVWWTFMSELAQDLWLESLNDLLGTEGQSER